MRLDTDHGISVFYIQRDMSFYYTNYFYKQIDYLHFYQMVLSNTLRSGMFKANYYNIESNDFLKKIKTAKKKPLT